MDSLQGLAIGVDLGGTHVLAALVDVRGQVYARHRQEISENARSSRELIGRAISVCIVRVWRHAQHSLPQCLPIQGVGIAVPGNVDPIKGLARYLPNFGWLEPVDLQALILDQRVDDFLDLAVESEQGVLLRQLLGVDRIQMRNDGRCAALGERHFGVGNSGEHSVMAMLTLGTGIGGALLHNPTPTSPGVLFDGCTFDAGDFGHHVIRSGKDAFTCVCGKRGCFETHASAQGLVRHWRAAGGDNASIILDDARSVIELMREGNSTAKAAFEAYRRDLETGLANLISFYNPSLLVLGGGLAAAAELYEGLQAAVDAQTLPATRGKCSIVQSGLASDCAALGAAQLVFSQPSEPEVPPARGGGGGVSEGCIVCLGLTCLDSTMWLPSHPAVDTKTVASRSLTTGGGNAANSAVAASRLRAAGDPPVRLISKLGSDVHGDALLAELARDEIDTRYLVRAERGHATPSSVILACGATRTIVHDPGLASSSPLLPSELEGGISDEGVVPPWLADAVLLHLDCRHPRAAVHAACCARSCGVPILLDVERPRDGLLELLPLADYVVSSSDFAHKLAAEEGLSSKLEEPYDVASFVLARSKKARWVCVTLGEMGSIVIERSAEGEVTTHGAAVQLPPSGPGSMRDSTGAGDAFIGATAAALRRGLQLPDILRLAAHVAAANCGADGARGGLPFLHELPEDLKALLAN